MHVVIDRSKWRTGGEEGNKYGSGLGETALLNDGGYMCCLGFACRTAGVSRRSIINEGKPDSLEDKHHSVIKKLIVANLCRRDGVGDLYNTAWVEEAMSYNDDSYITRKHREKKIASFFKEGGHTVEFVGEYEK